MLKKTLAAFVGVAAAIATAVTAVAAVAAMAGNGLACVAAGQRKTDDRKKGGDAKNQCTIHPKFLQLNRYRTVRNSTNGPSILSGTSVATSPN